MQNSKQVQILRFYTTLIGNTVINRLSSPSDLIDPSKAREEGV